MRRLSLSLCALCAALPSFALAQDIVLDEIVVTTNREQTTAGRTGASVTVITAQDLERAPESSVAAYFRKLAGVTIRTRGTIGTQGSLSIRGASQNYVGAYVDGIDVSDPSGTQVAFDFGQMTTLGLGGVEILKGSQSALFGAGAVGGVVSFTTARPQEDGLHQQAEVEFGSFNTRSVSYTARLRNAGTEAAFSLGRIHTDGFSTASQALGNTEADGFETTRASFYLARTTEGGATLGLNGFWEDSQSDYDPSFYLDGALLGTRVGAGSVDFIGTDDIWIPLGDGSTSDEALSRRTFGLRAFADVSTGVVDHRLGLSTFRIDRAFHESEVAPDYGDYNLADDTYGTRVADTNAAYSGLRLKADWSAAFDLGAGRMVLGADWTREQLVQSGDYGAADNTSFKTGVFAEYNRQIGEATDVALSARVDRHSLFGNLGSVRLAMAHHLSDATTLRFQAGTGFRAPSNFELYSFYGSTTLQPEKSTSLDFGIEHTYSNGARVKATAFYLQASDLIDFDFASIACPAAALVGPGCYNQVAGRSVRSGVEIEAEATVLGDLGLAGAYTYTDSSRNASSSWSKEARHKLSFDVEKPLSEKLTGRFGVVAEFGRPAWSDGTAARDYAVATASMDYDFGQGVLGYVRVENLFNTVYELDKNYGTSRRAAYVGLRAKF